MNKSFGTEETRLFGNRINLSGFTNLHDCVGQEIVKSVQQETDLINKGEIEYAFRYGGADMKIKKTGVDIVAKMTAKKAQLEAQVTMCDQRIAVFAVELAKEDISATEDPYLQDGDVPTHKRVQIYKYENGNESKVSEDEAVLQICRQYNDAVYKYYELQRDIKVLDVWIRNLDQKKSYDLTIKQLTMLGF